MAQNGRRRARQVGFGWFRKIDILGAGDGTHVAVEFAGIACERWICTAAGRFLGRLALFGLGECREWLRSDEDCYCEPNDGVWVFVFHRCNSFSNNQIANWTL